MVLRMAPAQALMVEEQQHGQRQGPEDVFRQARISHCNNMTHVGTCSSPPIKPSMARIQYELGTNLPYDYVSKDAGPSSGNLDLPLAMPKSITVKATPRFGAVMMAAAAETTAATYRAAFAPANLPSWVPDEACGTAPEWHSSCEELDALVVPAELSPRIRAEPCGYVDGPQTEATSTPPVSGWCVTARSASTSYPGPGPDAAALQARVALGRLRRLSATDVPVPLLYTSRPAVPSTNSEYGAGPSSTGSLHCRGGSAGGANIVGVGGSGGGPRDTWQPLSVAGAALSRASGERGDESGRVRPVSQLPYSCSDTLAAAGTWSAFASPSAQGYDSGPNSREARQGGALPGEAVATGRSSRVTFGRVAAEPPRPSATGGGQLPSPVPLDGSGVFEDPPLFPNASATSVSGSVPNGAAPQPAPPVHHPLQRRSNLQLSAVLQSLSNDCGLVNSASAGACGVFALRPTPPSLSSPLQTSPLTPAAPTPTAAPPERHLGAAAGVAALMEAVSPLPPDNGPLAARFSSNYLSGPGSASAHFAWAHSSASGHGTSITRHHTLPTATSAGVSGGGGGGGLSGESGCGPSSTRYLIAPGTGPTGSGGGGGGVAGGLAAAAAAAAAAAVAGAVDTASGGGGGGGGCNAVGDAAVGRVPLALSAVVDDSESDYDEDYTSPFVLGSEPAPGPPPPVARSQLFLPTMSGAASASASGGGGGNPAGSIAAAGAQLALLPAPGFKRNSLGCEDRLTPSPASPTTHTPRLPTATAAAGGPQLQPPPSPHRRSSYTPISGPVGPASPLTAPQSQPQLTLRPNLTPLQLPQQSQQASRRRHDSKPVSPVCTTAGGASSAPGSGPCDSEGTAAGRTSPQSSSSATSSPVSSSEPPGRRQRFANLIGLGGGANKRQVHPAAQAHASSTRGQHPQALALAHGGGKLQLRGSPSDSAPNSSLSPSSSVSNGGAGGAGGSGRDPLPGRRGGPTEISPQEHLDIMARMKAALSFLRRGD